MFLIAGNPVLVICGSICIVIYLFFRKKCLKAEAATAKAHALAEKQAQELAILSYELELSDEELSEFVETAVHDLVAPVRSISGFTQFLNEDHGDELAEDAREYLEQIGKCSDRLSRLLRELGTVKLANREAEERKCVELPSLFEAAQAELQDTILETQAQIQLKGEFPQVLVNPKQLTLVLRNLFSNALLYTRDGITPVVDICGRKEGDFFRVVIADNGIGFAERFHERILKMFKRLHREAHFPGDGIGLAMCRRIIARHGGTLEIESTEGKGSKFTFKLPMS